MAVGVSEAAKRLGVSRQRVLQMIAEQRLHAERIGRSWAVDEVDIALRHVPDGRPLSPDMTRGFLDLAAGNRPDLTSRDISRLRGNMIRLVRAVRSGGDPLHLLRSWLPRRATRHEMSVSRIDLPDVLADERLVLSGVSDIRCGMTSAHFGEGYLDERIAQKFFDDYLVVETRDRATVNLIVHVAASVPPVSRVLIAADLSEFGAPREEGQAHVVLEEWINSGDYDEKLLFGRRRP